MNPAFIKSAVMAPKLKIHSISPSGKGPVHIPNWKGGSPYPQKGPCKKHALGHRIKSGPQSCLARARRADTPPQRRLDKRLEDLPLGRQWLGISLAPWRGGLPPDLPMYPCQALHAASAEGGWTAACVGVEVLGRQQAMGRISLA